MYSLCTLPMVTAYSHRPETQPSAPSLLAGWKRHITDRDMMRVPVPSNPEKPKAKHCSRAVAELKQL